MSDNLVLGRGKVYFAPYARGASTGGTKGYFGNTPEFTVAVTNQKLDHYSSEQGIKTKDRSIILQSDTAITLSTDNIVIPNLMLWFGGNNTSAAPADAPSDLGALALIGSSSQIFGALFFESDNPVGDNLNYWFPYVSITPNGNYTLKGDTWQTLQFSVEALKRDGATERFYAYKPANGTSTAAADTTPTYLTANQINAASGQFTPATGGTITAPTPETAGQNYNVTYTNTGGTISYLFYNDGTSNVGSGVAATGASGTVQMKAPVAGTYTVASYNNAAGTGTILDRSTSITVN